MPDQPTPPQQEPDYDIDALQFDRDTALLGMNIPEPQERGGAGGDERLALKRQYAREYANRLPLKPHCTTSWSGLVLHSCDLTDSHSKSHRCRCGAKKGSNG